MDELKIYHKDGSELTDINGQAVKVLSTDDSDKWMGEHYVNVDIKSAFPVKWCIGDYIVYRGEQFEINYDPGKIKSSSKGTYGEAFKYSDVKFDSKQYELARAEFLDVVLYDNEQHYTTLPKFAFYVSSLDDIADRIQANLNEQYGEGTWRIYTRNKAKSLKRGCDEAEWVARYGEDAADNIIKSQSMSVSSQTCWQILSQMNETFDVNFITRGRNVYIGTAGIPADNIFGYGKGNGLKSIEQQADNNQAVTTRLRAYGSTKNLPTRYYTNLCLDVFAIITGGETGEDDGVSVIGLSLNTELFWEKRWAYFSTSTEDSGFPATIKANGCEYYAKVGKYTDGDTEKMMFVVSSLNGNDYANCKLLERLYSGGQKVYVTSGANKENWPATNKEYQPNALPNNMSINVLMLPGFPKQSLKEWWDAQSEDTKKSISGDTEHIFSEEKYRPYVDSINKETIGVRQASVYFDTDNEKEGLKEIYPTIEEMEVNGVRIDEIDEGSVSITDNGVFKDGATIPNFTVKLRRQVNFDINALKQDDFSIVMQDGMCAGRSFKVAGSTKNEDGRWQLTLNRVKDDDLELYFPYNDFPIKSGDHFVLTGIELPDAYVEYAAKKLLKYTIAWLDENDHTRYVYTPGIDNIYMARQNDEAEADATGKTISLYKTLRAGDMLTLSDEDLDIGTTMTIDQLTIKENEGKIPEYTVTLKEETQVGSIQRIENKIDAIVSGNGLSGGGLLEPQIKSLIKSYGTSFFLSKLKDDQAEGVIKFLAGLGVGEKYSISSEGAAVLETISAERVHDSKSTIQDRVMTGAQGYDIYMGENGKSYAYIDNLIVRQKALFAETEIRKVSYAGGSVMYSNAGSTIVKVVYLFDSMGAVTAIKCYAKADDGTTKTANFWTVGMMALCKTFNVAEDNNRYYWRLVVGTGTEMLEDGLEYYYVVLSNVEMFEGSDKIIPTTGEGVFTEEKGNLLTWGDADVMVAITQAGDNTSMADICGYDEDDEGTAIKLKTFYGYDVQTDGSNDLPAVGDVIVQVGDQIKWKSKGNLVAIRTSSEDEGSDDVPSITMYHSIGYPYLVDGYSWTYPYQWKTRVSVQSPEAWLVNANRFKFFTEDKESTAQTMASYIEATDEKISLKVNSDDLKATGIDITEKTITLTADKTKVRNNAGEEIAVFDADGTVTAGTLKTADTGGGSVEIKNGELAVKNPNGTTNILFGLTSDGYMVLRYYDNEGNLLYDLGPSGLTARSITGKSWGVVEFVAVTNGTDYKQQYLWSNGTWNDSAPSASSSYSARQYYKAINNLQTAAFSEIEDETTHTKTSPEGTQPRWAANGYTKVTLYKYYAGKVNGTAVKDDDAGLTAAEAALADGKWFKQQTKLGNGDGTLNDAYIVEGTYLPYNGIVKAGLPDTSVGKYPTYRLTGMASFVWGSEQAEQEVVSEDITQ